MFRVRCSLALGKCEGREERKELEPRTTLACVRGAIPPTHERCGGAPSQASQANDSEMRGPMQIWNPCLPLVSRGRQRDLNSISRSTNTWKLHLPLLIPALPCLAEICRPRRDLPPNSYALFSHLFCPNAVDLNNPSIFPPQWLRSLAPSAR